MIGVSIGGIWLILIIIKVFGGLDSISWEVLLLWPILRHVFYLVLAALAIMLFVLVYKFIIEPNADSSFFAPLNMGMVTFINLIY